MASSFALCSLVVVVRKFPLGSADHLRGDHVEVLLTSLTVPLGDLVQSRLGESRLGDDSVVSGHALKGEGNAGEKVWSYVEYTTTGKVIMAGGNLSNGRTHHSDPTAWNVAMEDAKKVGGCVFDKLVRT